jgi:hypothetical protein
MLSATESRVLGLSSETHQSVRNKPGIARLIISVTGRERERLGARTRTLWDIPMFRTTRIVESDA